MNANTLFIEAYARAIGVMALSTVISNLTTEKITKIMKNLMIFCLAGVALVWGCTNAS
jgi:hypothetical protein